MIVLGLLLAMFGLSLYKGFIKLLGFAVGAGYGVYLFSTFASNLTWDPILIYLVAGILILVLGTLGTFIARFANLLLFFLAGGLTGVLLGKIVAGTPLPVITGTTPGEIAAMIEQGEYLALLKPQGVDIIWFLAGGFVFLLSLDILLVFAFSILGAGLIWFAIMPLELSEYDWIIPLGIGLVGLVVQEGARRRAVAGKTPPRIKYMPKSR